MITSIQPDRRSHPREWPVYEAKVIEALLDEDEDEREERMKQVLSSQPLVSILNRLPDFDFVTCNNSKK